MDELLMDRVNQLKQIEERLERIRQKVYDGLFPHEDLVQLRWDVRDMIRKAEADYAAF